MECIYKVKGYFGFIIPIVTIRTRISRRVTLFLLSVCVILLVLSGVLIVYGAEVADNDRFRQQTTGHTSNEDGGVRQVAMESAVMSRGNSPTDNSSISPSGSSSPARETYSTSTSSGVDFVFSQQAVTISSNGVSPVIRATSVKGNALAWSVRSSNGILVRQGSNSVGTTVSHDFIINPSPAVTKPGTYTVSVTGYIPKGASVTKQVTVIVTQGPTFTLEMVTPDRSLDTETQFFVPFKVTPVSGSSIGPLTATATVINSNGSPISIQGVWDDPKPYVIQKKVAIMDQGQASGQIVIRVIVSDGIYTASIDIHYSVQ